jgi:CubicO group peptidase (beta-lactamase class C family)
MLLRLRDPYALVRDRHVERAVRRLSTRLGPGPHAFQYSNFGYGVLSRALASAAGKPFGELLRDEVLRPLGLADEVTLESDPDPSKRRVFGHSAGGEELEHWHNPALPGASFLFASVEGMGRYLVANLRPATTKLRAALELVHQPLQVGPDVDVGLGWLVRSTEDGPVYWHNGGTSGFGAFIAFDLARQAGVAVLMSRRHLFDLDEAAMSALSVLRRREPPA